MGRIASRLLLWVAWLGIASALPGAAGGAGERQALQPKLQGQALAEALKQGGYVLLFRHAATEHVAPDPGYFDVRDCTTQRNLSEEGRHQAELVGKAMAKLGIPVGEVLSSPYCRCLETGRIAFGHVTEADLLAAWDGLTVPEKSERGAKVRALLATPPADGANTVLITHTGTLLYSFGLDSRPEGIIHVFRPGADGKAEYVGKLTPDDWIRLAGLDGS